MCNHFKNEVSVVIATKDRPEELYNCFNSVLVQTSLPKEIIIVDDGQLDQFVLTLMNQQISQVRGISFIYKKKNGNTGQGMSYNLGASIARGDIVLFLDDDVVLFDDYVENILEVYVQRAAEGIGGVSGVVVNEGIPTNLNVIKQMYDRFFLLSNGKQGEIIPWGFQTDFRGITEESEVDWLRTGCASFRREVLKAYKFHQINEGRAELVDVEFGWRASRSQKLIVAPSAKLYHYPSITREGLLENGIKQTYTRCWMFQQHASKTFRNVLFFVWANFGLFLRNFLTGPFNKKVGFSKAIGNIIGLFKYISEQVWSD